MNSITADEVGSKPKASKPTASTTKVVKAPNPITVALGKAAATPAIWLAITCLVLVVSGGLRFWRDSRFTGSMEAASKSPFPLAELPNTVGTWRMVQGGESQLDPEIARVAGASDHVVRNYTNDATGETVSVLVVYGLSYKLFGHIPELCYTAAGYAPYEPMKDYDLTLPNLPQKTMKYRAGFYIKKNAPTEGYTEVVYSFRFADKWRPDVAQDWKDFRTHLGMFKIQIARPVNEFDPPNSPSVQLLGALAEAIEQRLPRVPQVAANR
jgi:hypothetical protein